MAKSNLEQIIKDLSQSEKMVGGNIIVANDKEILESISFGKEDKENYYDSSSTTVYRIASISKTVGAIGLMKLYEQNKVDLDEDISTYLNFEVRNPNYPKDKITLRMLMTQTSSILDGYDDENPAYDNIIKGYNGVNGRNIDVSLEELLNDTSSKYYTDKTYASYRPGSRYTYSNFGCGIMACIIEKVSNEYYTDYMENHIFKPLGLDASFNASHIKNKDHIATMYSVYNSAPTKKENFFNPIRRSLGNNYRGPAGGLFISPKDLTVIMQMLLNYGTYNGIRILNRETVEQMYQVQWCGKPKDGDTDYRQKGLQMLVTNKVEAYPLRGHTGSAYGIRSYIFFSLKHKIGTVFITNGILSNDESASWNKIIKETQNEVVNKHFKNLNHYVIEITPNSIILDERKIIDKNMFMLQNKYIKACNLADCLDTIGEFDEDLDTYYLKGKQINDLLVYKDVCYVNLIKTIELLNIKYKIKNDIYYLYI